MLQEELTKLKRKLIEYASLVETMIQKNKSGLLKKEKELLLSIMEEDEPRTNELEIEIDELCTIIVAQHNPVAVDLRTVLMILKINNDLERIGDLAAVFAENALYLIDKPLVKPLVDIPKMSEKVKYMLEKSINSFVNKDAEEAKSICEMDDEVDNLRDQVLRELITYMINDTSTIERSLRLFRITRVLERIADLSTNICEDIIFMVEGRVIKHHHEEEK